MPQICKCTYCYLTKLETNNAGFFSLRNTTDIVWTGQMKQWMATGCWTRWTSLWFYPAGLFLHSYAQHRPPFQLFPPAPKYMNTTTVQGQKACVNSTSDSVWNWDACCKYRTIKLNGFGAEDCMILSEMLAPLLWKVGCEAGERVPFYLRLWTVLQSPLVLNLKRTFKNVHSTGLTY